MQSDRQLAWRAKHGSRKALDELFNRYYREMYAYVYKQCGQRELALDLTQDTFVAVFRGLPSFDEHKAAFRTWLYHIAANIIADYYRSHRYHQQSAEQSLDEIEAIVTYDEDFLQALMNRERVRQVMEIVSRYDLTWVRIFQKKCFEELTFREIAAELDIPENTVKTRYYSMVNRVRKELQDEV